LDWLTKVVSAWQRQGGVGSLAESGEANWIDRILSDRMAE
jgi:hypothetical protein